MTSPTYRVGRPWWDRAPAEQMTPEREQAARQTMAAKFDDYDGEPAPRHLPVWNYSVQAILALERLLNDGAEPSLSVKELW